MHEIQDIRKQVMYEPNWQALRVSLLKTWSTNEGADKSISKLWNYVTGTGIVDNTNRYFRSMNLLLAVRMSYGGRSGYYNLDRELSAQFNALQAGFHKCEREQPLQEVPDIIVYQQWIKLEQPVRTKITKDLKKRLGKHEDSPYRADLRHFITLTGLIQFNEDHHYVEAL